jgi:hypothetical protein
MIKISGEGSIRTGQKFRNWIVVGCQGQNHNATVHLVCEACGREKFRPAWALQRGPELDCKCAPAPSTAVPIKAIVVKTLPHADEKRNYGA